MEDMAQGLRAAFGGATRRLEMIAENLANTRTPGYRAGEVLAEPFYWVLDDRVAAHYERDATDLSQGAIRVTDRPLDLALQGDGFFVVRSKQGEYLTRNGEFDRALDGALVTVAGHTVMGVDEEPIWIPNEISLEQIVVGEDGVLRANGAELGQLLIQRVPDETDLRRVGTTLFQTPPLRRRPADTTRVLNRALESSNSVVFQELSNMMLLNRQVEAMQRAQRNEVDAQRKMMDVLS